MGGDGWWVVKDREAWDKPTQVISGFEGVPEGLHQDTLCEWRGTTRTGTVVREERAAYGSEPGSRDFGQAIDITLQSEEEF